MAFDEFLFESKDPPLSTMLRMPLVREKGYVGS